MDTGEVGEASRGKDTVCLFKYFQSFPQHCPLGYHVAKGYQLGTEICVDRTLWWFMVIFTECTYNHKREPC